MTCRPILLCWTTILAFAACNAATVQAEEPAKESVQVRPPAIVPQPVSVEKIDGQPLVFDDHTMVAVGRGAEQKSIEQAVSIIRGAMGLPSNELPKERPSKAKVFTLVLDDSIGKGRPDWQAAESYTLTVAKDGNGVEIAASAAHGLFNGVQTLCNWSTRERTENGGFPAVKIEDYPRFPWRGYLLDPARHFRPKAEVLRYIDLLAMHKMNVLHLHLTDDQGWRIEIKRYPKLIEVGAKVPNYSGQKGEGWFYSQADIKEIVAYAADSAHYGAAGNRNARPQRRGDDLLPGTVVRRQAGSELCAGKESTFEFMANVLDEVAELFPSPFIHIGADEVRPAIGRACPNARSGWTNWPPPSRPREWNRNA